MAFFVFLVSCVVIGAFRLKGLAFRGRFSIRVIFIREEFFICQAFRWVFIRLVVLMGISGLFFCCQVFFMEGE